MTLRCRRCGRLFHAWESFKDSQGLELCVGCETGISFANNLAAPADAFMQALADAFNEAPPSDQNRIELVN